MSKRTETTNFERIALESSLREHPGEETARLAFTDWLIENGYSPNGARREAIRVVREAMEERQRERVEVWIHGSSDRADLCRARIRGAIGRRGMSDTVIEVVPGGTQLPGATVYDNGAFGNYGSGPATGVDYRGNTVSIATPGDIITNPDGTRTVVPNIPGRPYGGFTGVEQLKSRYTAGGGSLGYTAPIPKDPEASFNKQTDDSLAAYNFLMGKGKNLAQVNAASNKTLMQPYFTGSNRYKQKFLSYDKDGKVVSSGTSGKTEDAKAAELTKAKTIEIVDSSGYNTETYTAVLQDDGTYLAGNGKRYDVTGKLIAAGGGMMGYAMGGGLGSLGSYSDGGRLLKGPGDGVSDSIPATIGAKNQPARLADGEFVIPARIVSELGNGSTDAGAKKLYAMMDRVQRARGKTTGKNKVAANSRSDKYLPA